MSDNVIQNKELPKVICAISLIHVPTIIQSTICPHCGELNIEDYDGDTKNKELLTSCTKCDEDYKIVIPNFQISNNETICQSM